VAPVIDCFQLRVLLGQRVRELERRSTAEGHPVNFCSGWIRRVRQGFARIALKLGGMKIGYPDIIQRQHFAPKEQP
jgi:hypothetical protein